MKCVLLPFPFRRRWLSARPARCMHVPIDWMGAAFSMVNCWSHSTKPLRALALRTFPAFSTPSNALSIAPPFVQTSADFFRRLKLQEYL